MGFVLIIAKNPNIRRFCVENLVVRGHLAMGMAAVTEECRELLENRAVDLVLMYGEAGQLESEIQKFHVIHKLSAVPLVIIGMERPGPEWMAKWDITAYIRSFPDSSQLVDFLKPWLSEKSVLEG